MRKLIRKWTLDLRRRRLRKEIRQRDAHEQRAQEIRAAGADCSNCRAPLTGPFCHICGQRDDDFKRPIWSLLREILDNVFSSDSRLFKTLFLLVLVPGGLTRAFAHGRRAQFVPPLRLYITVSIMFFVIVAIADVLILDIDVRPLTTPEELAAKRKAVAEDAIRKVEEENERRIANGLDPLPVPPMPEDTPDMKGEDAEADDEEAQARSDKKAEEARERLRQALEEGGDKMPEEARQALEDMVNDPEALRIEPSDDEDSFAVGLPYDIKVGMFVDNDGEEHEGLRQEDIDEVLNNPETPEFMKDVVRGAARALRQPQQMNPLFNESMPRAL